MVQTVQVIIVGGILAYAVHIVQHKITAGNDGVESGIDRFIFRFGRKDIPAPSVTELVGVAVHRVSQVYLDIGQQGEVATV